MMTLLSRWKKSWLSYGTPSSSQITSEGTGSANASTRSVGFGPASIASIRSSTMRCATGRIVSIRLTEKAPVTIRRSRACSGSSMRMKLSADAVASACASDGDSLGMPGVVGTTLTLGSLSTARCSAYPVTSHGVLPSHSRTRTTGPSSRRAAMAGAGSKGQPGALLVPYSGIASIVDLSIGGHSNSSAHHGTWPW